MRRPFALVVTSGLLATSVACSRAPASQSQTMDVAAVPVIKAGSPFFGSVLYLPDDGQPHPGIVLLHGSEGGSEPYTDSDAEALAGQGYAALSFCYFKCKEKIPAVAGPDGKVETAGSMPSELVGVDLARTYRALTWLRGSDAVAHGKVALLGFSRGAEQSLLVASYLASRPGADHPDAVMVHAPFPDIVGGLPAIADDPACWTDHNPDNDAPGNWKASCGPYPFGPDAAGAWTWVDPANGSLAPQAGELKVGTQIPLASYGGPVLISHGMLDGLWPVASASKVIEARLRQASWDVQVVTESTTTDAPTGQQATDFFCLQPAAPAPAAEPAALDLSGGSQKVTFHYFPDQCHVLSRQAHTALRKDWLDFLRQSLGT